MVMSLLPGMTVTASAANNEAIYILADANKSEAEAWQSGSGTTNSLAAAQVLTLTMTGNFTRLEDFGVTFGESEHSAVFSLAPQR